MMDCIAMSKGDTDLWSLELYFVARVAVYITISGILVIFIFILVKYIGAYEVERHEGVQSVEANSETCPLVPEKHMKIPYGIAEEDEEDEERVKVRNSEDLFNANICTVCFGAPRNCFYVPCGHCATCYVCAHRIRDGDNNACPICRRSIRRIRKLCIGTQELEC